MVDVHDLPTGAPRPFVGERPSAYGEVTPQGARRLFAAMGLRPQEIANADAMFFDLGSGAGRLVAQANGATRAPNAIRPSMSTIW